MDTFAHAALSGLLCSRSGLPGLANPELKTGWRDWTLWAAMGFGALPDLSSFGVYLVQRAIQGTLILGKPELADIPRYVHFNYSLTHSLVVALVVGVVIFLTCKPLFLPFLAWPLHICCDIPMHERAFFSTPIFWPLSDWTFDGWSFATYRGMIVAYWGVIALLFAVRMLFPRLRRVEQE